MQEEAGKNREQNVNEHQKRTRKGRRGYGGIEMEMEGDRWGRMRKWNTEIRKCANG